VIVGRSPAMRQVLSTVASLQHSSAAVLIVGERGSGKEALARAIHATSPRRDGPFVALDCGAPPDELDAARADGGTWFLDAVDELPLPLQLRLVGLLEERAVAARLIAATCVDLARAVESAAFRADLYYRLAVVTLSLPPLRERREDLPRLALHLLRRHDRALRLSPAALRVLLAHPFPGNVRELENVLAHASAVCHGPTILPDHFPDGLVR
jgi:DNA-binding NtrC family response regulator